MHIQFALTGSCVPFQRSAHIQHVHELDIHSELFCNCILVTLVTFILFIHLHQWYLDTCRSATPQDYG